MIRLDAEQDDRLSGALLQLLGSWGLLICGEPIAAPSPVRRMLALLALRGPLSRPAVAGTLWPEVDDTVACGRLRTALWRLAQVRWVVDDQAGELFLAPGVSVDAHLMSESARCICNGTRDVRGPDVFEEDLLPQWYDDWLIVDRERIRQTRLHALEALSALRLTQGRHGEAVDAGLAAVRADPLRESAHRAVVRAHLAEGNIAEAIRQFRACRSLLMLELGVEPTGALVSLLPTAALGSQDRIARSVSNAVLQAGSHRHASTTALSAILRSRNHDGLPVYRTGKYRVYLRSLTGVATSSLPRPSHRYSKGWFNVRFKVLQRPAFQ